ncbi:hypothetical protein HK096_008601, partial [Nowakowskiella sp. JEL0078]
MEGYVNSYSNYQFPSPNHDTVRICLKNCASEVGINEIFKSATRWKLRNTPRLHSLVLETVVRMSKSPAKVQQVWSKKRSASTLSNPPLEILYRCLDWLTRCVDSRSHSKSRTPLVIFSRRGHQRVNIRAANLLLSNYIAAREVAGAVTVFEDCVREVKNHQNQQAQIANIEIKKILKLLRPKIYSIRWPGVELNRIANAMSENKNVKFPISTVLALVSAMKHCGDIALLEMVFKACTVPTNTKFSEFIAHYKSDRRIWCRLVSAFSSDKCGANVSKSIEVTREYLNKSDVSESDQLVVLSQLIKSIKTRSQASVHLNSIFHLIIDFTSQRINDEEKMVLLNNVLIQGIEKLGKRITRNEETVNKNIIGDISEEDRKKAMKVVIEIITRRLRAQAKEIDLDKGISGALDHMSKWVNNDQRESDGMADIENAISDLE